jgi:pSer/pThr/pTyr-binding forkhead associated (FHA) protein
MSARLVPLNDGPPIPLVKDLTLVGRAEDADVRIDHKSVSKLHCALLLADGLVVVRDLGSTNGTRVNGQRVRRGTLLPDDQLALAKFVYQFRLADTAGDPPPAAVEPADTAPPANDAAEAGRLPPVGGPPVTRNDLPDHY